MISLLRTVHDHFDERRARRLRRAFGARGWLLSWDRSARGGWLARLSCRELPLTVERRGASRAAAIRRAEAVLGLILSATE